MEKENNNNALQTLNVKQLDEILRELEVQGCLKFRRKQDKIDRILREVTTINEYLIRYKKQPIGTKPIEKTNDIKKLSERQKKRRTKDRAKLNKERNKIRKEIEELASNKEEVLGKIKGLKKGAHSGFKGKRILKLNKEAKDMVTKIEQSTKRLKEIESNPKFQESIEISQKSQENKRVRKKLEELNRKIRRAKGKSKRNIMLKREALKLQLIDASPKLIDGAFGGNYSKYRIEGIEGMDVSTFLSKIRASIGNVLRKETSQRAIRCQTTTWIRFEKGDDYINKAFNSRMTPVYMLSEMDTIVQEMVNHMEKQVDNPKLRDSKLTFDRILHTDIDIHRLNLTRGSSYIPLPDWLAKKKAIIKPKNLDNKCFKLAVIAGLKWEEIGTNPERISKLRKYENELDWSEITYPVSIKNISKFETRNEIGVNLLAINGRTIYIYRKGGDYEQKVNLMILEEDQKKYYVAIKSLKRLLSMANSKHKESQYFCDNCLNGFKTQESRDNHYNYCASNEPVRIEMPDKNPIVRYSNGQHQFKVPFIMYADFESILESIQGAKNNPNVSSTRGVNSHKPSGWCLHSKFAYGEVNDPTAQYRGADCVERFCEKIISEAKRLYSSFPEVTMLPLTESQLKKHKKAKTCNICFKEFKDKGKVRDHCHYTGIYRGAAHFGCSLRYKIPNYIPVVSHNLAGYDAHLFIRELAKYTTDIGVIAKNIEDYISFSIKVEVGSYKDKNGEEKLKEIELRFIDSFSS